MSIRDFNFAIDPTFDPARMPKGTRKALNACEVTMMMPFSVQCMTCSAFIYKGKKLNSKKEDVLGYVADVFLSRSPRPTTTALSSLAEKRTKESR